MNPFYKAFNGGGMPKPNPNPSLNPGPMGQLGDVMGKVKNLPKLMKMFNSFRSGFQGSAEPFARMLLTSGRISDEQFNQLCQATKEFQEMTGIR